MPRGPSRPLAAPGGSKMAKNGQKMAKNGVFGPFFVRKSTFCVRWGAKLAGKGNQLAPAGPPVWERNFPCSGVGPPPEGGSKSRFFTLLFREVNNLKKRPKMAKIFAPRF